jgi:hypothetical protein
MAPMAIPIPAEKIEATATQPNASIVFPPSAPPEMALLPNLPPSLKLWRDKLRHTQILILEILPYIPVVKTFVFLDLGQNTSFLKGHSLNDF